MSNSINLARLKSDANSSEALKNILSAYTWKRAGHGYRAKGHSGYSIYCKSGQWLFTSHNGDYKTGDVLTVAADVHGLDLKSKDGLHEAARIVCEAANLDFSKYCTDAPSDYTPSRKLTPSVVETTAYLPNAKQPLSKNFTFEVALPLSYTFNATTKYYECKTGAKQPKNVIFLQSMTHIETGKKTVFNHKNIGIAYLSNGLAANIKVKVIDTKTGKKKMFYIQNTGNYVFGLDSLPTENRKDFTLLICAGEDDTTAINTNLQPSNFAAVTFGSESATIPTDYLEYLRNEFKAVFCLLDSDKTGVKMAIRNATANGLPYISIGDYYHPSVKDVCDIYKQFGASELLKLVKVETKTKAVEKANIERIGYNLHKILTLDINSYISEKTVYLKSYILNNTKLLLQSPTDTGKTTVIIDLSKDPNFYKALGIDSIVLAVPRLFLCDQLKEKFEKEGITPSVINGQSNNIDIHEAYHSKVIICTYDSLKKLENHLPNCLLVIDEIHLLNEDSSFRGDVTAKVFELIPTAKRVLGLTATPNLEMCMGMQLNEKYVPNETREALNFTLCRVKVAKDQVKNLQLNVYSEIRINAVTAYCEAAAQSSDKAAVLLNDVKVLETVSKVINEKFSEATATILSSKKPAYNVENPTYNAIVKGEAVPTENRIFLGTNILTTGVSLNFPVQNVAIFGNLDSRTITQFAARPRRNGDVNKVLKVDLFKRMTKPEFESTVLSDFEQKKIETDESVKFERLTAIESLQNDIQTALNLCKTANDMPNRADPIRRKVFDELGFIYFDESKNEFKINLPRIIFRHSQNIEKRCTLYGKLVKAKQYDETFEILTPQYVDFKKNEQATETLKEAKKTAESDKIEALKIFAENKTAAFEIVFKQTFDNDLKEAIKTEITPHKELSDKAKELKTKYPNVTNTGELIPIINRYFDFKAASFGVNEISENKRMQMLVNSQLVSNSNYELVKNQVITLSELRNLDNGTLSNAEKIRALNSKQIIELMRDFEKSKRRNWLTAGELINIVSTATKRRVNTREAKMRVSELYNLIPERKELNGKKTTVYEILDRLRLEKVIKFYSSPPIKIIKTTAESSPKNAANLGQKEGKICRIEKQPKTLNMS